MLPLARYRLHWRATSPIHFPAYAGSMLRGAFGHALRRLACMTRQKACTGCPLLASCPYPAIFAPPARQHSLQSFSQIPAPYLIEPPAWGERTLKAGDVWDFSLVTFGRALKELPLITLALRHALQRGIGPGDGQSELISITWETRSAEAVIIYQAENGCFAPHETACPKHGDDDIDEVTLHLLTPLRLQENGHALPPRRLGAPALLMAATRRASLLAEFHGAGAPGWNFAQLKQLAATIDDEKKLEWKDWTRRSARQQQTMKLGGVVGTWTLRGNLTPFMPALHLGQWLHVGKETVFGLGHYQLEHKYAPRSQTPEGSPQVHETTKQNAVPR